MQRVATGLNNHQSLHGGKPLRYIYIDEAGSSAREPATIVAGIIVDADTQYVLAEDRISELLKTVPEPHRSDPKFVPHAKAIFHGEGELRVGWDRADRRRFIRELVSIAPALGIPVCIGVARRSVPLDQSIDISLLDHHHMMAFALCVAHADQHVIDYGRPKEVATLVAENIPERERYLRFAFRSIKERPLALSMEHGTPAGLESGTVTVRYTISRIRDTPHFVAKRESPLLWIADACAFAYGRLLSGGLFGAELVSPIRAPSFESNWADSRRQVASIVIGGPMQSTQQQRP